VLGFRPLELGFAGERERLEWGKVRSKEREESVTTLLSSPGRAARAGEAAMARSDRSGRYSAKVDDDPVVFPKTPLDSFCLSQTGPWPY
jgi:hypothetical protein